MDDLHKRFLLFLGFCIPIRFSLMYTSKTSHPDNLRWLGYLYLTMSIGMMYIYLTDSRKTGSETFGKRIWWNDLRPIFSTIYFLFAYNAIQGHPESYTYLVYDIILGFVSFILNHFT